MIEVTKGAVTIAIAKAQVAFIEPSGTGTKISFAFGSPYWITVTESYATVLGLLNA